MQHLYEVQDEDQADSEGENSHRSRSVSGRLELHCLSCEESFQT